MLRYFLAIGLAFASNAEAADFTLRTPEPITITRPFFNATMEGATLGAQTQEITPAFHIHMSGQITSGDAQKLEKLFFEVAEGLPFHYGVLSLDSPGGSFTEGLNLGDFIYGWSLPTFVFAGDTCLSACAIAFSAGAEEVIRGIAKEPARFVETGADFGYHAPFIPDAVARRAAETEMGKGNAPVDSALNFANQMFALARNITQEINNRSERWGLAPSLISEFLGYGPDEFYRIDSLSKARRSEVTVFSRNLRYPSELTWTDALEACRFRLYAHLSEFYNERPGFVMGPGDGDASKSEPVPFPHGSLAAIRPGTLGASAAMRRDGTTIEIDAFIPGRGNYTCRLSKASGGRWSVDVASGDLHRDRAFGQQLTSAGPVEVNEFIVAGPAGFFDEGGYEEAIRRYAAERLGTPVPAPEALDAVSPSYPCSGRLSLAEQLICDTPTLSYLDQLMAAEYTAAVKATPAAKTAQRDWLAARREVCQTERAELGIETIRVNQLRCLAGAMISQIEVLKAGNFQ